MIPDLPADSWIMKAYEYARVRSRMPDECVFWTVMSYCGAAIQDRVLIDWAGKPIYPNLPLLIVAPSGYGKTSTMHLVQRLFGRELPYKIPEDSTAESAAKVMAKYGGTYFRNSVAYWTIPEMADVFGKKDYQQGLIARVTRILDNPRDREVSRSTKDEVIRIPGVAVLNWMAGTTFEWLSQHVEEAVSTGGFLPRLMVLNTEEKPKFVPDPQRDEGQEIELGQELGSILKAITLRDPIALKLSDVPEWESIARDTYDDLIAADGTGKQPFIARRDENIIRIYLIFHTFTTNYDSLRQSILSSKWFENQAVRLAEDLVLRQNPVYERVLGYVVRHPEGVSFGAICRGVRGIRSSVAKAILHDLRDSGIIEWDGRVGGLGIAKPISTGGEHNGA